MKRRFFLKPIFIVAIFFILFSCSEEEQISPQQAISSPQTFSKFPTQRDTTYLDSDLQNLLDEELNILKNPGLHRLVDISGMEVVKNNPKPVYAHYMPWFQSKEFDGYWGQHWTMANKNPDIIDETGRRQIASYYYPLIGPYSSSDPDLHEYHFLMMKIAGIDGVIFDWYGSRNQYDYGLIKNGTETFIDKLEDLGMDFSIMYEDRVATFAQNEGLAQTQVEAASEDFAYIRDQYFTSPRYTRINDVPLLYVFGPEYITDPAEWDQIFSVFPEDEQPDFLTLWASGNKVGDNFAGEFLWVAPDHMLAHEYYYQTYSQNNAITVGGVYPGFERFYYEGGWSNNANDWIIDPQDGQLFVETLNYSHHEEADFLQLITWNDFGEGTMIEPTEEYGFMYLQLIQQYTQVEFDPEDLYIPLEFYQTRKKYKDHATVQSLLDRTYEYIKRKRFRRVKAILTAINQYF